MRKPTTVLSYSITELELFGLAINIAIFPHLVKRVDFDTLVDHYSLSHIMKSKSEPATWNEVTVILMRLFQYHVIHIHLD